MFGFNKRKQEWGSGGSSATAPTRRTVEASFNRDPIEAGWGIKAGGVIAAAGGTAPAADEIVTRALRTRGVG